jgi:hypothetical protein
MLPSGLNLNILDKARAVLAKIPEQIKRLSVVIGIIVVGVLVARFYIIPPSLIEPQIYRAATVHRETAKEIKFAGSSKCSACHFEESNIKKKSFHQNLSCESCHGASAAHTTNPMGIKPFAPRERRFCPVCHEYDPSRPTGFPQINPVVHNPLKPCISCHNPHDPTPPTPPEACSACHAEIARTKAVSPHALVGCTTCHKTPKEHKLNPRRVLAAKPDAREFCGQCHSQKADKKDAPKVDLSTHGDRYLCWQCHYPHLPGRL